MFLLTEARKSPCLRITSDAKILRKDGRGDRDYEIKKAVERVARIAKQSREWIDVYLPKFKKRSKLERAVTKIEGIFRRIFS